jgi:hypothetical protein
MPLLETSSEKQQIDVDWDGKNMATEEELQSRTVGTNGRRGKMLVMGMAFIPLDLLAANYLKHRQ